MTKGSTLNRLLLISIGIIAFAILVLSILVVPSVWQYNIEHAKPNSATPAFLVNILLQLICVVGLIRIIFVANNKKQLQQGFLTGIGVFILILGLVLIDAGFAFLGGADPITKKVPIAIFVSSGSDIIAAILIFFTPTISRQKQAPPE